MAFRHRTALRPRPKGYETLETTKRYTPEIEHGSPENDGFPSSESPFPRDFFSGSMLNFRGINKNGGKHERLEKKAEKT